MRYDKIIAMFLISLIVLLPVYVSDVMAADIVRIDAYGKDGISGMRGGTDTITIEADVNAPGMTTIGNNLRFLEEPSRVFSCKRDNTTQLFLCRYEYPETTSVDIIKFTLQMFNDVNQPISSPKGGSILVDSAPPTVTSGGLQLALNDEGKVEATFHAADTACFTASCLNRCSGIKKVEFKAGEATVGTYSNSTTECDVVDKILLSLTPSGTQTYNICMIATDNVGQSSDPACSEVTIDKTAPSMIGGVSIFDVHGDLITATKGEPVQIGSVRFNITEDTELDKVMVDLIGFDPRTDYQEQYKNIIAQCAGLANDKYACMASPGGAFLAITQTASLSVRITAIDKSGNKLNTTVNYPITFDNTAPVFSSLTAPFTDDRGIPFINESGFSLKAAFAESGVGMSKRRVVLDTTPIGTQDVTSGSESDVKLRPNSCSGSGGTWTCEWKNLRATAASGRPIILSVTRAADDAGNEMNKTGHGSMILDDAPPEVLYVNITPIGETGLSVIGAGDILQIKAYVQDNTPITGFANFSNVVVDELESSDGVDVVSPNSNVDGACEEFTIQTEEDLAVAQVIGAEENSSMRTFVCTWETEPLRIGYHPDEEINFRFFDLVGHVGEHTEEITIYARPNQTNLEEKYWELDTEKWVSLPNGQRANSYLHPSTGLDRFIWAIGSQAVYQEFTLTPAQGNPRIVDIDFSASRCMTGLEYIANDDETGDFAIQMLGYDNRDTERHDAILLFTEPSSVPEVSVKDAEGHSTPMNSFNVTCQMGITSIVDYAGGRAIALFEVHNFSIVVPVYNNPLGQNLQNVEEMIADIEDEWLVDSGAWLTVMREIFEYMNAICGLIGSVYQLIQIFTDVTEGFRAIPDASGSAMEASVPPGRTATQMDIMFSNNFLEEVYGVVCGLLVSCQISSKAPEQDCTGKGSWCKFKKGWAAYNQAWIGWMDSIYLTGPKLGDTYSGEAQTGENKQRRATYNKKMQPWGQGEVHDVKAGSQPSSAIFGAKEDFDPKRSIISSVLSGCLPGIIHNIEKQRQLLCQKLYCYKVEVPTGTPIYKCDEVYARGVCIHWVGQIFYAIPILQYWEGITDMIQSMLEHPEFVLPGMAIDVAFGAACGSPAPFGFCAAAQVAKWGTQAASAIMGIVGTFKGWKYLGIDWCDEALKDNPDINEILPSD